MLKFSLSFVILNLPYLVYRQCFILDLGYLILIDLDYLILVLACIVLDLSCIILNLSCIILDLNCLVFLLYHYLLYLFFALYFCILLCILTFYFYVLLHILALYLRVLLYILNSNAHCQINLGFIFHAAPHSFFIYFQVLVR